MKIQIYVLILVFIFLISSCAPSGYMASPNGDFAEITLLNDRVVKAELLYVTETNLIVEKDRNLISINNNRIKQLYFGRYSDNSWITGVALMEVLPAVAFTVLASGYEINPGSTLAITLIPAVISTSLFILSAPKTTFNNLSNVSDVYELKKFARYPGGVTERQLNELLKHSGQDSLINLE